MTGAACLYCTLAVLFCIIALSTVVALFVGIFNNDLDKGQMLPMIVTITLLCVLTTLFAVKTEKTYDLNFAVAMKNIKYEHVYEHTDSVKVEGSMEFKENAIPDVTGNKTENSK